MSTIGNGLAHGIARRSLRTGEDAVHKAHQVAAAAHRPGAMKRAAIYRALRNTLLDACRGRIIALAETGKQDGKDKGAFMQLWTWGYAHREDDPATRALVLRFHQLEARKASRFDKVFALLSHHAVARLLQTERTENLAEAITRTPSANWVAIFLASLLAPEERRIGQQSGFLLNGGVAVGEWDDEDGPFFVKTVIGDTAMNPYLADAVRERRARGETHVAWPMPLRH